MMIRALLAICTIPMAGFASEHLLGTWKLNLEESKYDGMPAPKDTIATYTADGAGWKYEAKGTSGDGQPMNMSFAYVKDNEDIKFSGSPIGDTLVIRGGASNVNTATFKRDGKVVGRGKRTISKDGKRMTLTGNTTMADGKKAKWTAVYDKQ